MPKLSGYTNLASLLDNDEFILISGGLTKNVLYSVLKASIIGGAEALVYKGVIDCAASPNYPAADAGHVYVVSVAGKIGGASGPAVEAGDMLICNTDGTASGNHATVGTKWNIVQTNIKIADLADTTLSGTPRVISIVASDGNTYYFKGYPTKV